MLQRLNSAALAALVAVVALLGWPLDALRARSGLDPSWQLAGTFVHTQGLDYGGDVVFNFGPLGFVVAPIVGGGRWFVLGVAGLVVLLAVTALALFGALRLRGVGRPGALAITAIVMLLAPTDTSLAELVVLAVGLAVVSARWSGVAWPSWAWPALGALAAVLTLVKISTGPVLLAVVLVSAVLDEHRTRALATTSASYVAGLLAVWVSLAQPISDLGRWLRGAFEIGAGHTEAMSLGTPGGPWQYGALLVVVIAPAVLFVGAVRDDPSIRRSTVTGCVVTIAVLGWFLVKQGFVRRDGHAGVFFFEAAVALVVLVPWRRCRARFDAAAVALVVVAVVAFLAIQQTSLVRLANPVRPVVDVALTAELLASPAARTEAHLDANRAAREDYGVPQQLLDRIGGAPVHVDPWEITLAWAYGLNWRPIPTLQNYLGYTEHLDGRNADALTAADGPRFVLRTPHGPIDGRFPLTDGPAYHLALLCDFALVDVVGDWELFERTAPRCGPIQRRHSVDVRAGDSVELPAVGADTAVLIAVEYKISLFARLATFVLKPPSSPQLAVDGRSYRMIPATSGTPGLLVVPDEWRDAPEGPREVAVDRPATITFFTMDVRPPDG